MKTSGRSHSRKVGAEGVGGVAGEDRVALVDDGPAERGELVEERLFDVGVLGHDLSRGDFCEFNSNAAGEEVVHEAGFECP